MTTDPTSPTRDRLREAAKKAVDARAKADANQNDINLVHRADEADWELGELLDGETILSLLDDLARAKRVVAAAKEWSRLQDEWFSLAKRREIEVDDSVPYAYAADALKAAVDSLATGQGEVPAIQDGKATRDLKAGETISVPIDELTKLKEQTLRDYFAAAVVSSIWKESSSDTKLEDMAIAAYGLADAMLNARKDQVQP